MRFLIDAQLPPRMADWFEARGYVAEHVSDIGLVAGSDDMIAQAAIDRDAILVTKDEDFIVLRLPDRFVLLWLRIGNATNAALDQWMVGRWAAIEAMLAAGERFVEVR